MKDYPCEETIQGCYSHSMFRVRTDELGQISTLIFFLMFIYLGEIERQSGGGAEREGATESQAGSRPRAVSTEPDAGLEPMKRGIMTWATQVPQIPRFLL